MFNKSSFASYATYIGGGTGAMAIEQQVIQKSTIDITNVTAAHTIENSPWIAQAFPTMVENGSILVKDGHLYFYGLSLLEIASLTVMIATFFFTVGKFVMDYKTYKRKSIKEDEKKKELKQCGTCGDVVKVVLPIGKKEK